jgi:hypothetical protein
MLSIFYYFVNSFLIHNFHKSKIKINLIKKINSQDNLDINEKQQSNKTIITYTKDGCDERFPIQEFDFYLSSPFALELCNDTITYKTILEEYKNILKIRSFLSKQKSLSYLENKDISIPMKMKWIHKYYRINDISDQNMKNGGLFDDFKM